MVASWVVEVVGGLESGFCSRGNFIVSACVFGWLRWFGEFGKGEGLWEGGVSICTA